MFSYLHLAYLVDLPMLYCITNDICDQICEKLPSTHKRHIFIGNFLCFHFKFREIMLYM